MDLAKIKAGLENGRYRSASECIDDFKRVLSDCSLHNPPDDTIAEKAHSLEKFLEAKLALMPKEVQEVDAVEVKKSAKEISGLQDYMSSYFTPEQGRRSRRRTQQYEVGPSHKPVKAKKRKIGEVSSRKMGKKKVFVQSSSPRGSQVSVTKAHISRHQKEIQLVSRVHEKGEGKKLEEEVEEIDEYIVEEGVKSGSKVEDEVIEVESGDSGNEEESDDSESGEDWATQYSNSIRRFYKNLH